MLMSERRRYTFNQFNIYVTPVVQKTGFMII